MFNAANASKTVLSSHAPIRFLPFLIMFCVGMVGFVMAFNVGPQLLEQLFEQLF